jgi:ubiquitin conjugation factor E4 B
MKDPVILPASKISIDLATIKRHLLSDPSDPFRRSPLKIEDVVPSNALFSSGRLTEDHELKAKIQQFMDQHRANKIRTD